MKGRLGVLAVATVAIIGVSYLRWSAPSGDGGGVHQSRSAGRAAEVDRQELQRLIGAYEDRLRTHPNEEDFAFLGQLYLQRGRQTGDVQTYLQAQYAISEALALDPTNPASNLEMATVRYTTHDFSGALDLAGKLLASDGQQVGALGVSGDARLELGNYAGASDAYAKVAASSPGAPAIEVRLARLDFIMGKVEAARRMAAKAEDDAIGSALGGPDLAYYEAFHGQVELDTGHYDSAARFYGQALAEAPDYYLAVAGMGRTRAAQGRMADAISLYEKAVAIVPQPDFLAALGDLYRIQGQTDKAKVEYDTVEVIATLAKINQQVYNRLLAVFYADHGIKPDEALRLTQAELAVRKDVYGYDAYAWALYQNGRYADARAASDQALARGTADAKLLYHSGLIAKAMGDTARARAELSRALALSPTFDVLQAPRARAALDSLARHGRSA
jgi:tetratricopeptide (TPR) repeat protein